MAHAYTPGLKVTAKTIVRKTRRLPLFGAVVVKLGQKVGAHDVVARTDLPGKVFPLNVANLLHCTPGEVPERMLKAVGSAVKKEETIAQSRGMFGLFKGEAKSPINGTLEDISKLTGQVMLREVPTPVEVKAYINGEVVEIIAREGVILQTVATLIQGIFGLGGETEGELHSIAKSPGEVMDAAQIDEYCRGKIVIGGGRLTVEGFRKAIAVGAKAIVTGGFRYQDIKAILGYDLGVAITGTEQLGTTLVVTEGFGDIAMARATFDLLKANEGKLASVNGATQIRAGVIRPEVVIPLSDPISSVDTRTLELKGVGAGDPVRIIRAPYFGMLGKVVSLPVELKNMESETKVRVMEVALEDGRTVTLPRANVEAIERA